MALLSKRQTDLKVKKEIEKQQNLIKKQEIQKNKEIYGENWKQIIQTNIVKDMESEIGADIAPHIYDFKDVYDYFDPIYIYKSEDGKKFKMDYDNFVESEEKFRIELDRINLIIDEQNKQDGIKQDKAENSSSDGDSSTSSSDGDSSTSSSDGAKNSKSDRTNSSESDRINSEDNRDGSEDKDSILEDDGNIDVDDVDSIDYSKTTNEIVKDRKKKIPKYKVELYGNMSKFFSRFTPLYNKHICTCCGQPKPINGFYPSFNISFSNRIDEKGTTHMYICKECTQKLFYYLYTEVAGRDVELTMKYVCTYLNLYWDVDLFVNAQKSFENSGRKGTLIGEYIKIINKEAPGKMLIDSKFLKEGYVASSGGAGGSVGSSGSGSKDKNDTPYDWSKEDYQNKQQVISIMGRDPFEKEDEQTRKILYSDFLSITDDDINNDYIKKMSAISIVKGFDTIRKLEDKLTKMAKENAPLTEQKAVTALRDSTLKSITEFSSQNGFTERFKTKQSRGENTFTGICAKIDKQKFEKGIANRYDVATSEAIQQASDASFKSIFSQLSINEAELYKVTSDQLAELRKLRSQVIKLEEELRKTKYKLAEVNMKEKLREKEEVED